MVTTPQLSSRFNMNDTANIKLYFEKNKKNDKNNFRTKIFNLSSATKRLIVVDMFYNSLSTSVHLNPLIFA